MRDATDRAWFAKAGRVRWVSSGDASSPPPRPDEVVANPTANPTANPEGVRESAAIYRAACIAGVPARCGRFGTAMALANMALAN